MRDEILSLIKEISGQQSMLVLPRLLIDITLDIKSALLLSQLIYWSDRTADRSGWIYKSHKDWQTELGLNRYFLDKARDRLIQLGLIEVKIKKANGSPTMHFRVKGDVLGKTLNSLLRATEPDKTKCRNLANGNARVWQNKMSKFSKSLTETTTEITTQTDIEDINNNKKNLPSHHRRPANKYTSGRYGRLVRT
jgi:hypothetical protein